MYGAWSLKIYFVQSLLKWHKKSQLDWEVCDILDTLVEAEIIQLHKSLNFHFPT